ncbi:MAG: HNH endonuclease family protein [Candidatus Saccharimonadales bacterium]
MNDDQSTYIARRRRFSAVALLMLLLLIYISLTNLNSLDWFSSGENAPASELPLDPDTPYQLASDALQTLPVADPLSRHGYSRERFSPGWAIVDGCDMRNRILQRDLRNIILDADNCQVLAGTLNPDPYTETEVGFIYGNQTDTVHIDHIVAVSDAWRKGAQDLSAAERHTFYNDPLNLIATSAEANMDKGDADAAHWLPHPNYRCRYVARQTAIKLKYLLWITRTELAAMRRVLNTCPLQVLPIEEPIDAAG